MKKHILIGTLFALVLLASVVRASETVEQTDLADMFQGFDGTFVMYDEGAGRYTVFNKARSETRFSPCSTFKVFHALIGLDSGVLDRDDARTLMKWNGKPSSIAAWNHDQTLASAMRHSVVWYFQRVAAGIGEERMRRGLDRIGYGNRDISGGLTRFWLQSSLKISPREQVGLLRALFDGSLPFASEDIAVGAQAAQHPALASPPPERRLRRRPSKATVFPAGHPLTVPVPHTGRWARPQARADFAVRPASSPIVTLTL